MIPDQFNSTVKRILLCDLLQKCFSFGKKLTVRNHILAGFVCCTDDLLKIHAGTTLIHPRFLDLRRDLFQNMLCVFLFTRFQSSYQLLYISFNGKIFFRRLFFHINEKASAKKITIFNSFLSKFMGYTKLLLSSGPASHTDRNIQRHQFLQLILNRPADLHDLLFKLSGTVSHEKSTNLVISGLICHSCFFFADDLITDIKKDKRHQCTLLAFLRSKLTTVRIQIQIKNSHTITCCLKIDSQCCKLFQTFLPCLDIIHKALQRSGTDHNGVFLIILGSLCQTFQLLFFFSLLVHLLLHFSDNISEFHGCHRLQHIFTDTILDRLLGILEFSESAEDHDHDVRIIIMEKTAQFHTIHIWHKDICKHDIHRMVLYKFRCCFPVITVSYKFTVHCFPVNILPDRISNKYLIIYQ